MRQVKLSVRIKLKVYVKHSIGEDSQEMKN